MANREQATYILGAVQNVTEIAWALDHSQGSHPSRRMSLFNDRILKAACNKQTYADPVTLYTFLEALKNFTSKLCLVLIISSLYLSNKLMFLFPGWKKKPQN